MYLAWLCFENLVCFVLVTGYFVKVLLLPSGEGSPALVEWVNGPPVFYPSLCARIALRQTNVAAGAANM
ncbi:hypothetical protein [Burkholderia pseudomallei]|uniref:hypothetical protein n=1 Tax=Burkholderia pseudomallei TaxID=28450 RepID=UPI0012FD6C3D|nr:hypothetical protein [Burkholderia pseudomallei]